MQEHKNVTTEGIGSPCRLLRIASIAAVLTATWSLAGPTAGGGYAVCSAQEEAAAPATPAEESAPAEEAAPAPDTTTSDTPAPDTTAPDTTAWFRHLAAAPLASLDDGFRAVLVLRRGYDDPSEDFDHRLLALLPTRTFRSQWDLLHGPESPVTRGQVAYMLAKSYPVRSGLVSRAVRLVWALTERYAYRDLVDQGIVPDGGERFAMTGSELLDILDRAQHLRGAGPGAVTPIETDQTMPPGNAVGIRSAQGDVDADQGEDWKPLCRQARGDSAAVAPPAFLRFPATVATGLQSRLTVALPGGGELEILPLSTVRLDATVDPSLGALEVAVLDGGVRVTGGRAWLHSGLRTETTPMDNGFVARMDTSRLTAAPADVHAVAGSYGMTARATRTRVWTQGVRLRVDEASGASIGFDQGETDQYLTPPWERAASAAVYLPVGVTDSEVAEARNRPYDGDPRPSHRKKDDRAAEQRMQR